MQWQSSELRIHTRIMWTPENAWQHNTTLHNVTWTKSAFPLFLSFCFVCLSHADILRPDCIWVCSRTMIRKCGKCVIWYAWLEVSLPFFSSWKSQVASIIYTSLRLFLSFPLCSAPSPPDFFFLLLLSISPSLSLLAIWLLQARSLAYCRMCRCHQKLFTFQRFDAVLHVYKLHCRHFALARKQKRRGHGAFLTQICCVTIWDDLFLWCFLASSFTLITFSIMSVKGGLILWWRLMGCFSLPRHKWTLNIHAVQGIAEYIAVLPLKG